ncbi:MAG: hypothetical protein M3N13_09910 [Candidatus Eremiobacteraeota bacterium]|nr:hypothetical protein [Candidatus Eremiobacteraeota bacterium]
MGALAGAIQQTAAAAAESKIKHESGVYEAQFVGMSEPFTYVSPWGDKCRLCKGQGRSKNGNDACRACEGSGNLTEKHAYLHYKFKDGSTEEEEVNFKLLPAGTNAAGQPLSPTTLFIRLRSFSGNREASPAQLDEWYTSLVASGSVRVPITLVIGDNKSGTALKITAVQLRQAGASAKVQPPPPPDNDDDESLPF